MHSLSNTANIDIFCHVIDNYGDIATCWRLALQLKQRHQRQVRLWVDDLHALKALHPETDPSSHTQLLADVWVCHWTEHSHFLSFAPLVIEAFACQLPPAYRQGMLDQKSLCINLEYFSCEDWVIGCHGLRSFQSDGLNKYFFFPGIQLGSGGVLYEADYESQRSSFTTAKQQNWCQSQQIQRISADSLCISLFGYENQAIIELIEESSQFSCPVELYLPLSKLCHFIPKAFPTWQLIAGNSYQWGNAHIHIIPFLPQVEYDRLLWMCDLNFVRGEESLIRGLLAAKPLVWHIYPTEDNAHWHKLQAFFSSTDMPNSLQQLHLEWNAQQKLNHFIPVLTELASLKHQASLIQKQILSLGDLTTNLIHFIDSKKEKNSLD